MASPPFITTISALDRYGPLAAATIIPPMRYPACRFGDGVAVEPAATNLAPSPQATITGPNVWSFLGTKSNALVATGGAISGGYTRTTRLAGDGDGRFNAANVGILGAGSFLGSIYVRPTVDCNISCVATRLDTFTSTVGFGTVCKANVWTRVNVAFTAVAAVNYAVGVQLNTSPSPVGTYLDAANAMVQSGSGPLADYFDGSMGLGYAWTGTANASTSTRTAGQLTFNTTQSGAGLASAPLTMTYWVRIGPNMTGQAGIFDVGNQPTIDMLRLILPSNGNLNFQAFSAHAGISPSPTIALGTLNPGDLVFCAGTFDGTTLTVYGSKNGAAVTSASANPASVPATTFPQCGLGFSFTDGQNQTGNPHEQAVIYRGVLSAAEIAALAAASAPLSFADDPRIAFTYASADERGTTNCMVTGPTNYIRVRVTVPCTYPKSTASLSTGALQNLGGATVQVSVPAGSGIGVGDYVSVAGGHFLVTAAFLANGASDDLYLLAA